MKTLQVLVNLLLPPFVGPNWNLWHTGRRQSAKCDLLLRVFSSKTPVLFLTIWPIHNKLRWVKTRLLFEFNPHLMCRDFLLSLRPINFFSVCNLVFDKPPWSFLKGDKLVPLPFYPAWCFSKPEDTLFYLLQNTVKWIPDYTFIISIYIYYSITMHLNVRCGTPATDLAKQRRWIRTDLIPATSTLTWIMSEKDLSFNSRAENSKNSTLGDV